MYVVQLLLPKTDNQKRPFAPALTHAIEEELTERFGGVTAYSRTPAKGIWEHGGGVAQDDIIVVEVMMRTVDVRWWETFRSRLERELAQEEAPLQDQPRYQQFSGNIPPGRCAAVSGYAQQCIRSVEILSNSTYLCESHLDGIDDPLSRTQA